MALALGHAAFVDEDYARALELYNQAVLEEPSNAGALVSRAQVHIKLGHFTDAIADAKAAIDLNPALSKAHLRQGIACFSLGEYETARAAFEKAASLEDDPKTRDWIHKCDEKLKEESGVPQEADMRDSATDEEVFMTPSLPPPKYRHEWYQSQEAVVVTVFAKGIKQEDARIDFGEQMLSVVIRVPNENPYALQVRLFGKVNVPKCKCSILSTKIEIRLSKADDTHWKGLSYEQNQGPVLKTPSRVTAYPSSSKKAAEKNWDKLEAEVKKEEKDEKLEGDAALNKLFREIYGNADEDTRRAMNKSFVESNGTVLSTNWKEVGSKKIAGSAPQGMEMKKWEV
ncbi:hypothetical protein SELMODRAFT_271108 [Selaginella moellendorffii]|uniref:Uncharacterized protein n=1 Tax=Selaginella moellendorffii TaxID=88036 RepID=D8RUF6_SELML|nr:protein SGT1 homolog A [Selaginella moellendorffii]EFJ24194.1 hypothetical protein SELMODRAFT_271108 [Selaginella moellendorffii]|eukprot:XP_002974674.1 protein SGT1 homolog A [Selaginella moellendorffii]